MTTIVVRARREAQLLKPELQGLGPSGKRDAHGAAFVQRLLSIGRPTTVALGVAEAVVHPLDRVLRAGPRPHVGQEVGEGRPTTADLHVLVPTVTLHPGVHRVPADVRRALPTTARVPMNNSTRARVALSNGSAVVPSKIPSRDERHSTARTAATPHRLQRAVRRSSCLSEGHDREVTIDVADFTDACATHRRVLDNSVTKIEVSVTPAG